MNGREESIVWQVTGSACGVRVEGGGGVEEVSDAAKESRRRDHWIVY